MPEEELIKEADKHNLEHFLRRERLTRPGDEPKYEVDRKLVIDELTKKDAHLRAFIATLAAVVSVIGAIISLLANFLK